MLSHIYCHFWSPHLRWSALTIVSGLCWNVMTLNDNNSDKDIGSSKMHKSEKEFYLGLRESAMRLLLTNYY